MPKAQKDVEALNKRLTIQLDNLCQFLPQEKVIEFSKMTHTELLLSTEKAIGDGSLFEMHQKLITGGCELAQLVDKQCGTSPVVWLSLAWRRGSVPRGNRRSSDRAGRACALCPSPTTHSNTQK